NVEKIGVAPTPVLAYLTSKLGADVGVAVTASHNPPQYNGLKFFNSDSSSFDEKSQEEIEKIIACERYRFADWRQVGRSQSTNAANMYFEMIKRKIELRKNWHVVVDCGCGATSSFAATLLRSLGCRVTAINAHPDGFFPARSSEPNAETLVDLAKTVKLLGADVGAAYDGDGDRVAFVDEKGDFVDFDRVLAAYIAHVAKKMQHASFVTNVEASMSVEKVAQKNNARVIRTKVGDVFLSEAIKKFDAVFGGEPCGAWIHPQFHLCPDGMLSSALMLKALEEEDKTLSQLVADIQPYPTLRANTRCEVLDRIKVMKAIEDELKTVFSDFKDFSTIDGARLVLKNGWVLVRMSGTEPLIRVTVEGESLKVAKEIMQEAIKLARKAGKCKQK
ncbi:MAG: phosphoglucosamine mutase, partial [Candidatus Bathyarchaeia archaeon]